VKPPKESPISSAFGLSAPDKIPDTSALETTGRAEPDQPTANTNGVGASVDAHLAKGDRNETPAAQDNNQMEFIPEPPVEKDKPLRLRRQARLQERTRRALQAQRKKQARRKDRKAIVLAKSQSLLDQEISELPKLDAPPAPPNHPIFPTSFGTPQFPGAPPQNRYIFRHGIRFIIIPTFIAAIYFWIIASSQYYAKAEFAIRSQEGNSTPTMGSSFFGAGGGTAATSDMFIVREYIQSRQILEDLKGRLDLRKIYSTRQADFWARLNPKIPEEDLLRYWQRMTEVRYDSGTGIATLGVRAFTAEEAKLVADHVLELSEALVNRLSERAQRDRVALSEQDVHKAYGRVIAALDNLQKFQQEARQVDPESFVAARSEVQSRLEQEISTFESQLQRLRRELPDEAPSVKMLAQRLDVARGQLVAERLRSTKSPGVEGESAAEVITEFSKLRLESEFAAKAYDSALASLEKARMDAASQTRYLEAFVNPQLPDRAEFPRRIFNVFLVAVCAAVLWAIGSLVIAAIREHV